MIAAGILRTAPTAPCAPWSRHVLTPDAWAALVDALHRFVVLAMESVDALTLLSIKRKAPMVFCPVALPCFTRALAVSAVCEAVFEASIDRACTVPSDCVLVSHDDCCGVVEFGVSSANSGSFPGAEAELRRCAPCPPLGCAHARYATPGFPLSVRSVSDGCVGVVGATL